MNVGVKSRPSRFHYLLAAELVLIILYPFLGDQRHPLFGFLALPTVIAGICVVTADRRIVTVALGLGVFAIAGNFVSSIEGLRSPGLICWMVFSVFILVVVLHTVLMSVEVSMDTLYGAIAAYLLIGVVWGMAYDLLEIASPGSFFSLIHVE